MSNNVMPTSLNSETSTRQESETTSILHLSSKQTADIPQFTDSGENFQAINKQISGAEINRAQLFPYGINEASTLIECRKLNIREKIKLLEAIKHSSYDQKKEFLIVNWTVVDRIYIRSSFQQLLNAIRPLDDTFPLSSFRLLGTPGVGKTCFSLVFIKKLFEQNIPFIYDAPSSTDEPLDPLFVQDGKIIVVKEHNIEQILDNAKALYYIVDGKLPLLSLSKQVNVSTLLVCLPRTEYFKKFDKEIGGNLRREVAKYYLPTWSINELTIVNPDKQKLTPDILERRFSICGGVPRLVFSSDSEQDLICNITRAINESDLERHRLIVGSKGLSDTMSFSVMSLAVEQNLKEFSLVFSSQHVKRLMENRLDVPCYESN